jgi:hypothetical protein
VRRLDVNYDVTIISLARSTFVVGRIQLLTECRWRPSFLPNKLSILMSFGFFWRLSRNFTFADVGVRIEIGIGIGIGSVP